jgi:hypothetical protein
MIFPFEFAGDMNDVMNPIKTKQKEEGMYILRAGNKVALNLVVGSRTFRLAEFKDFDVAYNFAMSIQARNEELKIFVASS